MKKVENKNYDTGISKWTHGQKIGGYKEWHRFLGPCPDCGLQTFDYGGGWRCVGDYCMRSVSNSSPSVGKAPEWWETNVNVKKDGTMWHAFFDDYKNPMESVEGFGKTPNEAVAELIKESNEKTN